MVDQALLNLTLQGAASFDPTRRTAATFLKLMVRNAIRQVRASYARPGHATRVRKVKGTNAPASAPGPVVVSLHELEEVDQRAGGDGAMVFEARFDAAAALRSAPALVATSLRRLYLLGDTLNDVARDADVSSFRLSRAITEFTREVRAAA